MCDANPLRGKRGKRALDASSGSIDGRWLLSRTGGTINQIGGRDILGQRLGVDSAPTPLVASTTFDEAAIALSPDGRWLAYESNETGRLEVFVRPFPNTGAAKWQVSTSGGWPRSGRRAAGNCSTWTAPAR
jgi:serine/threonine-protein kinase